ncbi:hypothetical protein EVAR_7501_1 [Eumeta japonica]|uniref:Uncharacterized protein n=1 Tax=Eumeta variegata TaxID=151549 RepID=A0A4C1Y5H8_EUMVA|nr:hypothetical protein EVAR_7501_1 [Eumeta japonica]
MKILMGVSEEREIRKIVHWKSLVSAYPYRKWAPVTGYARRSLAQRKYSVIEAATTVRSSDGSRGAPPPPGRAAVGGGVRATSAAGPRPLSRLMAPINNGVGNAEKAGGAGSSPRRQRGRALIPPSAAFGFC